MKKIFAVILVFGLVSCAKTKVEKESAEVKPITVSITINGSTSPTVLIK